VGFQYYDLNNYNTGLFTFGDGSSRNLSYTVGFSRNNKGHNPIFPTSGAEIGVTGKFTFPYSLFNGVDYANLENQADYKMRYNGNNFDDYVPNENGSIPTQGDFVKVVGWDSYGKPNLFQKVENENYRDATTDVAKVDQKKYNWLEYYKI